MAAIFKIVELYMLKYIRIYICICIFFFLENILIIREKDNRFKRLQ